MLARTFFSLVLLAAFAQGARAGEKLTAARLTETPHLAEPGYLQSVTDPVFGTPYTRVTDAGRQMAPGTSCGRHHCTHHYSSSQAWNADQTLLVIANGCSGFCFLDGHTYKPLFARAVPGECEWHPTNPKLMICVTSGKIYVWAPVTDEKMTIFAPDEYANLQFGPYKGNPSRDGARLVVRATNRTGALVAFAYDINARKKYPDIRIGELPGSNGYCTISPSGLYVFCAQKMPGEIDEAYVFTLEGAQRQHWRENHRPGHGDMTVDTDGSDVYVGISKADPDKYHVIKRRLVDGVVTDLAPFGEAQHASLRSINLPGWVFLTYTGTYSELAQQKDWAPFYQEVLALRMDGSGEIRRIVQTRAAANDYWSEAHASPSPDGTQVIWSSNWGNPGAPVVDYVARLAWPEAARPHHANAGTKRQ